MRNIFKLLLLGTSLLFIGGTQSCKKSVIKDEITDPDSHDHAEEAGTDDIASKFKCQSDSDCTTINADCCGCGQGGKQRAVHTKEKSEEMLEIGVVCAD